MQPKDETALLPSKLASILARFVLRYPAIDLLS